MTRSLRVMLDVSQAEYAGDNNRRLPSHTPPSFDFNRPVVSKKTYLACIGTRPEIIKMAPVYREFKARGHQVLVVHTGQHGAIAEALYAFFDMPPDITIDLQRKSSSLTDLTAALLHGIDDAVERLRPDALMVQGDTTSALVGALVGYYHDKSVIHIEAGLRTHEREPFPEEKNRELIGRLASWHFPPTQQASLNLQNEGVDRAGVFEVGNTVIDAALWAHERIKHSPLERNAVTPADLLEFEARYPSHRLILVTAHRRENWGQPIRNIAHAVARVIEAHGKTVAVWPLHPNPAVRADVESVMRDLPPQVRARICVTEPLSYQALIAMLVRCEFTLTDSGGIQEEASAFRKPVLIARNSTERQELVDAGGAKLVGTEVAEMVEQAGLLLTDPAAYRRMQLDKSPFGDGKSAQRIVDILIDAHATLERSAHFIVPSPEMRQDNQSGRTLP
ncbi:UDP-N-acetylglucosamine 2-epimerase (non-hydrolysing) [Pandoraea thiooxydans]|nr:UDP-N-acetylglucosamine 2-epimerase [Pandoraea thiooxydans]APR95200.1 UDP-N-acetylglucosamine 2-epimerase (non-hydrolysing) [Pandoraea thiooxydans]